MPQGRKLSALLGSIRPPMEDAAHRARQRWDACAKPLGSLGLLEDMVTDMAALIGTEQLRLTPRAVLVLCADNGVVAQGVSQSGCEVTGIVARELAEGKSNVCRMAALARLPGSTCGYGNPRFCALAGCSFAPDRQWNGRYDFRPCHVL